MNFQIKNRWDGSVQFECELSAEVAERSYGFRLGFAVRKALEAGADLTDANLTRANLTGADLTDANLTRANLTGADLTDANLTRADLTDADLTDANLTRADLTDADLTDANLTRADLTRADLTDANLTDANLTDANLTGADLSVFKQDLIAEVLRVPDEIEGLRQALLDGRIDGSTYSGECSCLAGTVAKLRKIEDYDGDDIEVNGFDFHADPYSPRERWFMMIRKGHTPENNSAAKLALAWIDEAIAIRDHIRGSAKVAA